MCVQMWREDGMVSATLPVVSAVEVLHILGDFRVLECHAQTSPRGIGHGCLSHRWIRCSLC